jgi:ABC-type glycerol-3-phosphate transport system substrate-binding protein
MSKKLLLGLLIMLLAAPIFATGSAEKEAMKALDDVDPSGQEVLYWFQHSRAREEAIQKLIAEFNATKRVGYHYCR